MKNLLQEKLFELQDEEYKNFQSKLIPTVDDEKIIGVRVPELRKLTKKFFQNHSAEIFFDTLPHDFFEENFIHVVLLSEMKNFEKCLREVKKFFMYFFLFLCIFTLQNTPKIFFHIIAQKNPDDFLTSGF